MNNHHLHYEMQNILKYFPELNPKQINCFEKMGVLYQHWNDKINVISRKDIGFLYERHILHSLAIAKIINFQPHTKIMDAGTGGGFPGIPLAILFPESEFVLVDSIGKKIKVVQNISDELGLKNVQPINARLENIREQFDFVVSRAVAALPEFVRLVRKNISSVQKNAVPNGIFYLKGGDLSGELKGFGNKAESFEISQYFNEPFFRTKKIIFLPVN